MMRDKKKIKTGRIAAFALFCLCGCVPEPAYRGAVAPCPSHKWDVPLPPLPQYRVDESQTPCARPLFVDELLDIALRNHPLTKNSWNLARAAAFNVGVNQSALYPTVAGQETLNFIKSSRGSGQAAAAVAIDSPLAALSTTTNNVGTAGAQASNSAAADARRPVYIQSLTSNLSVSYLLLDFGGRWAQIEAARQALLAANWTHNRTLQDVMINVLRAYYDYVGAAGIFDARLIDLEDARINLDAATSLFEAGLKSKVDALQAQSLYVNAELQLETARGEMSTALGALSYALGLPPNTPIEVASLPEDLPAERMQKGIDQLIADAQTNRPDLAAFYANYQQNRAQILEANAAGKPTITANVNVQRTRVFNASMLNGYLYGGSISLNIPLFAGFLYENQEKEARAQAAAAYAQFKNQEIRAYLDVSTSYYAYQTALESLKYGKEYLRYTEEAYRAALDNYREGTGSFLDLLVAQTNLSQARAQLISARTSYVTSIANVAYATGKL